MTLGIIYIYIRWMAGEIILLYIYIGLSIDGWLRAFILYRLGLCKWKFIYIEVIIFLEHSLELVRLKPGIAGIKFTSGKAGDLIPGYVASALVLRIFRC